MGCAALAQVGSHSTSSGSSVTTHHMSPVPASSSPGEQLFQVSGSLCSFLGCCPSPRPPDRDPRAVGAAAPSTDPPLMPSSWGPVCDQGLLPCPHVLALWCQLGTSAWGRGMGTCSSIPFWDALGRRLSKAQGRLAGEKWGALAMLGGVLAHVGLSDPACSPPPLRHIPSLERFLPPGPFFQRHFSPAAVSCPSSCFVAPAILTTRLTIYPDGAGPLSWAWLGFSIYKFCAEAERTKPNKLCESSRALRVLFQLVFSPPRSQPLPVPPFMVNSGGFDSATPSFPCAIRSRPDPAAIRNWHAFIFLALILIKCKS